MLKAVVSSALLLALCAPACNNEGSPEAIIADHNAVDAYDRIPDQYLAEVKQMLVDLAGESHSSGYRIGMDLLMADDPRFAVDTFLGSFPAVTGAGLRFGGHGSVGEEDFFTNAAAIANIKSIIAAQESAGNPIHVMGLGWCWDLDRNALTLTRDPVYNVAWAGSTAGGPQGDRAWGLDAADFDITGNTVCMDTYLNTVEAYNKYCDDNGYRCVVVFTTGPVDGSAGTESGLQREIKHQYIRNFARAGSKRVLFDYADILCWSDAGAHNTAVWNDGGTPRAHDQIHPDNMRDLDGSYAEDGDHIGQRGALRLAKAMWWMLARLAGWDGQ